MARMINLKGQNGGNGGDFQLLETDIYKAKIAEAAIEEDRFAEPNKDGSKPTKLLIRWEVTEANEEQDDGVVGCAVWQRLNPWYGTTRDGGPSKFKAFLDSLRDQGLLPEFDDEFDLDMLPGIEQRISVEKYTKTMGNNAGQPGNKVLSVAPLRRAKKAKVVQAVPAGVVEEEDLPF